MREHWPTRLKRLTVLLNRRPPWWFRLIAALLLIWALPEGKLDKLMYLLTKVFLV
jgi:hypothetical protein